MPATYEPLGSQTLTGTTASVTFSNIPGTFTDLVLVGFVRSNRASTEDFHPNVTVNGDTGSNYSNTRLLGNGSGAFSSRTSNVAYMSPGDNFPAANATSNNFGALTVQFMSYANTNVNKTVLGRMLGGDPGNAHVAVSLWRSTAAITSITLAPFYGSFVSGCTFSLYGIKAA